MLGGGRRGPWYYTYKHTTLTCSVFSFLLLLLENSSVIRVWRQTVTHSCRFPPNSVPVPGMETHIPVLFLDLNGNRAPLLLSLWPSLSLLASLPPSPHHLPLAYLRPAEDFHHSYPTVALAGGLDALLGDGNEDEDEFFDLHIVKHFDPEVEGSFVGVVQLQQRLEG